LPRQKENTKHTKITKHTKESEIFSYVSLFSYVSYSLFCLQKEKGAKILAFCPFSPDARTFSDPDNRAVNSTALRGQTAFVTVAFDVTMSLYYPVSAEVGRG
jgi:hypothetical protein